ncbi:hypothetical protein ACSS7Z_09900 [Microbacterium sp. A82]
MSINDALQDWLNQRAEENTATQTTTTADAFAAAINAALNQGETE